MVAYGTSNGLSIAGCFARALPCRVSCIVRISSNKPNFCEETSGGAL